MALGLGLSGAGGLSGWLLCGTCVRNLLGGFSPDSKCPSVPFPAAACPQPTGANAHSHPKPLVLKSYWFGFFAQPIFVFLGNLNSGTF